MGRVLIYIFTFVPMMCVNMMITCYSFNQNNIKNYYQVNQVFLAVMDAFIFILLAAGTFLKFTISNSLKPVETCLITSIIAGIAYAIIAIIALAKENGLGDTAPGVRYFILTLMFILFSFFSFSIFPSTFSIFCHSFSNKEDGALVGIWSSRSNVGHIIGYVLSNLLVYSANVRWQVTMIICAGLYILSCILLWLFVKNPESEYGRRITTQQCYQFARQIWRQRDFKFYIVSLSLFKAILFTYEFYTPQFVDSLGYGSESGYVPSTFDLSTIVGSLVIGFLYQSALNSEKDSVIFRGIQRFKLLFSSFIIVIICILIAQVRGNVGIQFGFGVVLGIFLGATYNFLQNQQILTYSDGDPRKGDMYATFCTAVSTIILGIIQLIIALGITAGKSSAQSVQTLSEGVTYLIMAGIGIIAIIVTLLRSFYQYVKQNTEHQQLMIQLQKRSLRSQRSSVSSRSSRGISDLSYIKR